MFFSKRSFKNVGFKGRNCVKKWGKCEDDDSSLLEKIWDSMAKIMARIVENEKVMMMVIQNQFK